MEVDPPPIGEKWDGAIEEGKEDGTPSFVLLAEMKGSRDLRRGRRTSNNRISCLFFADIYFWTVDPCLPLTNISRHIQRLFIDPVCEVSIIF